jgi:hypothetical protein
MTDRGREPLPRKPDSGNFQKGWPARMSGMACWQRFAHILTSNQEFLVGFGLPGCPGRLERFWYGSQPGHPGRLPAHTPPLQPDTFNASSGQPYITYPAMNRDPLITHAFEVRTRTELEPNQEDPNAD